LPALLRCEVYPGQFSTEYTVLVRASTGKQYSLFAPQQVVECDAAVSEEGPVNGWIEVRIVDVKNGVALVQLPQSTLEDGQFLPVSLHQIERRQHLNA
jgi:hypothetical protein